MVQAKIDTNKKISKTENTAPTSVPQTVQKQKNFYSIGETTEGLSNRFVHGASLDVIQRLEPFCDTELPLQEKSIAYLIPYGYNITPTTSQIEIVETGVNNPNSASSDRKTDNSTSSANINTAGEANPWKSASSKVSSVIAKSLKDIEQEAKETSVERTEAEIEQEIKDIKEYNENNIKLQGNDFTIGDTVTGFKANKVTDLEFKVIKSTVESELLLAIKGGEKEVDELVENNRQAQASFQAEIDALNQRIFNPRTSPADGVVLNQKKTSLITQRNTFNTNYNNNLNTVFDYIKGVKNNLDALRKNSTDYLGYTKLADGGLVRNSYRDSLANGILLDDVDIPSEVFNSIPNFSGANFPAEIDFSSSACGDYNFGAFVLMMNPEKIESNLGANYSSSNTWGDISNGQNMQWTGNNNATLNLSDVKLPGFSFRRVVQPIVDEAFNLVLQPSSNTNEPRVWSFVWGNRRFEPCVVETVRVEETGWYKGKAVVASVSITLKKVANWQVNDGLDVVVYDPSLTNTPAVKVNENGEADSTGTSSTDEGGNTSTSSEELAALKEERKKYGCKKPYKCKKREDYNKLRKSEAYANKSLSTKDSALTSYIVKCNEATGEKLFEDDTDENIGCNWDRCCRVYEGLAEKSTTEIEDKAGIGGGSISTKDCDTINVGALQKRLKVAIGQIVTEFSRNYGVLINIDNGVSYKTQAAREMEAIFNSRDEKEVIKNIQTKIFGAPVDDPAFKLNFKSGTALVLNDFGDALKSLDPRNLYSLARGKGRKVEPEDIDADVLSTPIPNHTLKIFLKSIVKMEDVPLKDFAQIFKKYVTVEEIDQELSAADKRLYDGRDRSQIIEAAKNIGEAIDILNKYANDCNSMHKLLKLKTKCPNVKCTG